jgi:hypothetical protein
VKVNVVFDDAGNVLLIDHSIEAGAKSDKQMGSLVLAPANGQRIATLDVPSDLEKLAPRELHDAVRVDLSKAPRLARI